MLTRYWEAGFLALFIFAPLLYLGLRKVILWGAQQYERQQTFKEKQERCDIEPHLVGYDARPNVRVRRA